jgi:hypothetical protein
METSNTQPTTSALAPAASTATQPPAVARPPSPPTSESAPKAEPKVSTSRDGPGLSTPPFSPSSQTPMIGNEQEEFEGTIDVNNDIPSEKDLQKVGDLLVLDAQGQSRPFKELYNAPHVAPRQLIIFIRHFFCGVSTVNQLGHGCLLTSPRTARNSCARSRPPSHPMHFSLYPRRPS